MACNFGSISKTCRPQTLITLNTTEIKIGLPLYKILKYYDVWYILQFTNSDLYPCNDLPLSFWNYMYKCMYDYIYTYVCVTL